MWEITSVRDNPESQDRIHQFLADFWEPFAVIAPGEAGRIMLFIFAADAYEPRTTSLLSRPRQATEGVGSEAGKLFHMGDWFPATNREYQEGEWSIVRMFAAFTVAELGQMLRDQPYVEIISCPDIPRGWRAFVVPETPRKSMRVFHGDTEADARAKMLIYLIEKKLIHIA
jgi:hypothetical protein